MSPRAACCTSRTGTSARSPPLQEYGEYGAYRTPVYFQDDWLNQYCDAGIPLHDPARGEARPAWQDTMEGTSASSTTTTNTTTTTTSSSSSTSDCHACRSQAVSGAACPVTVPRGAEAAERQDPRPGLRTGPEQGQALGEAVSPCSAEGQSTHSGEGRPQGGEERQQHATEEPGGTPPAPAPPGCCGCSSDYRFVYMGPQGTWTPLHADVLRSFSWSANVCGRKRWLMLSPDQIPLITHRHSSATVYDVEGDVDGRHFPRFQQTGWLEVVQEAGEMVFVPSSWYHQVTNLEDTISINHNWINSCSIQHTWRLLEADHSGAAEAISDVLELVQQGLLGQKEYQGLLQRNLAANSGMNFDDFLSFLVHFLADRAWELATLHAAARICVCSSPPHPPPAPADGRSSLAPYSAGTVCALSGATEGQSLLQEPTLGGGGEGVGGGVAGRGGEGGEVGAGGGAAEDSEMVHCARVFLASLASAAAHRQALVLPAHKDGGPVGCNSERLSALLEPLQFDLQQLGSTLKDMAQHEFFRVGGGQGSPSKGGEQGSPGSAAGAMGGCRRCSWDAGSAMEGCSLWTPQGCMRETQKVLGTAEGINSWASKVLFSGGPSFCSTVCRLLLLLRAS